MLISAVKLQIKGVQSPTFLSGVIFQIHMPYGYILVLFSSACSHCGVLKAGVNCPFVGNYFQLELVQIWCCKCTCMIPFFKGDSEKLLLLFICH